MVLGTLSLFIGENNGRSLESFCDTRGHDAQYTGMTSMMING